MKKYLVVISEDVADEGSVGLIKVLTQEQLDEVKSVQTGFGNIEGDTLKFNKSDAKIITDLEIEVLEKFEISDISFGDCSLLDKEGEYID